jgi:hypothetical protein
MQKTYIVIALDRSYSMRHAKEATLRGLNEQIAKIRKDAEEPGPETFVSFYTFNRTVTPVYKLKSVNFLNDIKPDEYIPDGGTALYDGIGVPILDIVRETEVDNPDNSYLFIGVSDGIEDPVGCSQRFNRQSLAKLITGFKDQNPCRWTFTYLGANQDLGKVQDMGFGAGNVANYSANLKGSEVAWAHTNRNLDNYLKLRKRGVTALKSFHSNAGGIADYSKLDMNSIPSDFDYSQLILEKADPAKVVDIDAVMRQRTNVKLNKAVTSCKM